MNDLNKKQIFLIIISIAIVALVALAYFCLFKNKVGITPSTSTSQTPSLINKKNNTTATPTVTTTITTTATTTVTVTATVVPEPLPTPSYTYGSNDIIGNPGTGEIYSTDDPRAYLDTEQYKDVKPFDVHVEW